MQTGAHAGNVLVSHFEEAFHAEIETANVHRPRPVPGWPHSPQIRPASAAIFADVLRLAFNPDEPRDDQGRWTSGGPNAGSAPAAHEKRTRSQGRPARPVIRSRSTRWQRSLERNANCQRRPQGSRPSASGRAGSGAAASALTFDDECALLSRAAYGGGAPPPGWISVRTITRPSGLQATLYYNAAKKQFQGDHNV